jgi:hypothetical protein
MLNNRFIVRYSEHLAGRLSRERGSLSEQVAMLYELAYSRPATWDEMAALSDYANKHGLPNTCRLVLNSNEFMFVN